MKRRQFLKQSMLASGYLMIPQFLKAFERGPEMAMGARNLVIVQFSGGNDGLNTIVPYENDVYYRQRKTIAIPKDKVIPLQLDLGFNPALQALKETYDQGYMAIVNNVGYPNPDRSHFRSMDIWQSASASNEYLNTGWIGRYLDSECQKPYEAIEVDDALSLSLKGHKLKGMALRDPRKLYGQTKEPYFKEVASAITPDMLTEDNMGYLLKTMTETTSSASYIFETYKTLTNTFDYPDTAFAKELKTIASFIGSGLQTKVYYLSLGSFDTHVGQNGKQDSLLTQYAEGMAAFINNLKQLGKLDDTLVMTFSEFGRRVEQNASNGTDHGTASNLMIFGSQLKKKGIINNGPDLDNLLDGDLQYQVDFRQVYATVLDQWLGANSASILNHSFTKLGFL